MRRDWNDDEIMYLYRAVRDKTAAEAAAHLGRTVHSVQSKVCKLGIKFRHKGKGIDHTGNPRGWTRKEEIELLGLLEKMPTAQIARELGRPYWSVVSKMNRMRAGRRRGAYSLTEIAELLQVGATTVRRHMILLGIRRRGGFIRDERHISRIAQSLIDGNDARLKPSIQHLRRIVSGEWSKAA